MGCFPLPLTRGTDFGGFCCIDQVDRCATIDRYSELLPYVQVSSHFKERWLKVGWHSSITLGICSAGHLCGNKSRCQEEAASEAAESLRLRKYLEDRGHVDWRVRTLWGRGLDKRKGRVCSSLGPLQIFNNSLSMDQARRSELSCGDWLLSQSHGTWSRGIYPNLLDQSIETISTKAALSRQVVVWAGCAALRWMPSSSGLQESFTMFWSRMVARLAHLGGWDSNIFPDIGAFLFPLKTI